LRVNCISAGAARAHLQCGLASIFLGNIWRLRILPRPFALIGPRTHQQISPQMRLWAVDKNLYLTAPVRTPMRTQALDDNGGNAQANEMLSDRRSRQKLRPKRNPYTNKFLSLSMGLLPRLWQQLVAGSVRRRQRLGSPSRALLYYQLPP
jgi:hypothetical protein